VSARPTTTHGGAESPVIEARGLVKRYGRRAAVDGLDLRVEGGEIFGFLGPNGAGKTTTVRMLLGLARPSAGSGRVLGRRLGDPEARRAVGYLPENVHFPAWFTGLGFLRYHGALYGLSRRVVAQRAGEALERLGLAGRGDDHLRTYSHGMLQRLGLAQALLARPRLVFLDEPTSALDPRGRRDVRELLDELRRDGTTVFLNSHLLSEVERTCDRVAVVANGKTRYVGPTNPDADAPRELDVRVSDLPVDVAGTLAGLARVKRAEGDLLRLELLHPDAAPTIARRLVDAGARLHELRPVRRELEDLFLELTGAPATGDGVGASGGGTGPDTPAPGLTARRGDLGRLAEADGQTNLNRQTRRGRQAEPGDHQASPDGQAQLAGHAEDDDQAGPDGQAEPGDQAEPDRDADAAPGNARTHREVTP
jgi:ABC-2 type transport system ATP-binding protein